MELLLYAAFYPRTAQNSFTSRRKPEITHIRKKFASIIQIYSSERMGATRGNRYEYLPGYIK